MAVPQDTWHEVARLRLTTRSLIGLNVAGFILVLALIVGIEVLAPQRGLRVVLTTTKLGTVAWMMAALITPILHEVCHALAGRSFGAQPRFGIGRSGALPYFWCASEWTFPRKEFLTMCLAPLVTLDIFAILLMIPVVTAPVGYAILLTNTAGAIGDLWTVITVLRYPRSVRVCDSRHANIILAPGSPSNARSDVSVT